MIDEAEKKSIIMFVNVRKAVKALSSKHLLHNIDNSFVVILNGTNIACDTWEVISRSYVHSIQ